VLRSYRSCLQIYATECLHRTGERAAGRARTCRLGALFRRSPYREGATDETAELRRRSVDAQHRIVRIGFEEQREPSWSPDKCASAGSSSHVFTVPAECSEATR
jgi:hypothetical protein